ncbi:MAG: ComEC/Rec2 family competence protein [Planctomycetes bacterium]|nr:ComEC/Rec2 family competence protein [Planctomycetota bacterium]
MSSPCLAAALAAAAGIALQERFALGRPVLAAAVSLWAAATAWAIVRRGAVFRPWLALGLALIAAFRSAGFPPPLSRWPSAEPRPVSVVARVSEGPVHLDGRRIRFHVRNGAETFAVFAPDGPDDGIDDRIRALPLLPQPGDRVRLDGILLRPEPPTNPGERFPAERELLDGRTGTLIVPHAEGFARMGRARGVRWCLWRIRERLRASIRASFSARHADSMEALLLGERRSLDPVLLDDLRATGTIHVVAISGFHVAIVAAFALWILRVARARPVLELSALAATITVYAALAGFAPSVLRAAITACAALGAAAAGIRLGPRNGLGLAALAILFANPRSLHQVGFQLSAAAVWGIIRWGGPGRRRGSFVAGALRVSTGALLGTAPLVAYHFHRIQPASPIWNLAACPLIAAALVTGLGATIAGLASPALACPFAGTASLALDLLAAILSLHRALPDPSIAVPGFGWGWILAYYALAAPAASRVRSLIAARLALAAAFIAWSLRPLPPAILVLDVGGDVAVAVRAEDRTIALLTAGSAPSLPRILPGAVAWLGGTSVRTILRVDGGSFDLPLGPSILSIRCGSAPDPVPPGAILVAGAAALPSIAERIGRPAHVIVSSRRVHPEIEASARACGAGFSSTAAGGAVIVEPRAGAWHARSFVDTIRPP